jgi:hypothetical protein
VIAHVAGVPVEELLPLVPAAVVLLVGLRVQLGAARRRRLRR